MVMLASDLNNPEYVNPTDPDAALHVHFYKRPVLQTFESQNEGRQIFKSIEYIKITTAGDDKNIVDIPLREDHKVRFRSRYEHYKKFGEGGSENLGIPLSKWALLGEDQVENLKAAKFYSVEQVASASDEQLTSVGMHAGMAGTTFRMKARQYLASIKGDAAAEADAVKAAAREKELQELRDKDAAREKEMAEMKAMLEKLTSPQQNQTITAKSAKAA